MSPADKAARDAVRDAILRKQIQDLIWGSFRDHPEAQTALFAVAQYADRESDDAVHGRVLISRRAELSTASLSHHEALGEYPLHKVAWKKSRDAIPLWAAWCVEGGSQGDERPIVLYRRQGDALSMTITWIAEPIRPELDGVEPLPLKNRIDADIVEATRERLLHGPILEQVREAFRAWPTLQGAWLAVSQHWDDEAFDAVHAELIYSQLPEPSLDGIEKRRWIWRGGPPAPSARHLPAPFSESQPVRDWDTNHEAIPLFAAWCTETFSDYEDFRPIVHYRRAGDDITVTWIAEPLRPWLDGVRPLDDL